MLNKLKSHLPFAFTYPFILFTFDFSFVWRTQRDRSVAFLFKVSSSPFYSRSFAPGRILKCSCFKLCRRTFASFQWNFFKKKSSIETFPLVLSFAKGTVALNLHQNLKRHTANCRIQVICLTEVKVSVDSEGFCTFCSKQYKELQNLMLSSQSHLFLC